MTVDLGSDRSGVAVWSTGCQAGTPYSRYKHEIFELSERIRTWSRRVCRQHSAAADGSAKEVARRGSVECLNTYSHWNIRRERNVFGVQLVDHDGERWLRLIKIELLLTVSSTSQAETKVCETLMKE